MPSVILIDTSVLVNVLNFPGFNSKHHECIEELTRYTTESGTSLLLPMASIIEAGNHAAHITDGQLRRKYSSLFSEQVKMALSGNAPWTPTQIPESQVICNWLDDFPDHAMAGIGLGDLSIIKEWESACTRHPGYRVKIWSIDGHLSSYDRRMGRIFQRSR